MLIPLITQSPFSINSFVWNPEWIPDFVFKQAHQFDTLITDMPLGPEERRGRRAYSLSTYTLNFSAISKGMASSINDFFIDSKGPFRPFDWVNPLNEVNYSVRFLDDSLNLEEVGENLINMEVRLRQLF